MTRIVRELYRYLKEHRRVFAGFLFAAVFAVLFMLRSLAYEAATFVYNIDYDNYLSQAFDLAYLGKMPLFGPWVTTPFIFRLGPAYIYMLAACMRTVGTDPISLWHALLMVNLAAVVLWGFFWSKALGIVRGALLGALLLSVPALYLSQQMYFFHAQWALLFVCGTVCSLYLFDRTHLKTFWYVAVICTSIAMHFHLTCSFLLLPLLVMGWRVRDVLGRGHAVLSLLLMVICNAYLFFELSMLRGVLQLLHAPASGRHIVDAGMHGGALLSLLGPFQLLSLPMLLVGCGIAFFYLVRREKGPRASMSVLVLALLPVFLLSGALLRNVHILPVHYVCVAIPFMVLAYYLVIDLFSELAEKKIGRYARWPLILFMFVICILSMLREVPPSFRSGMRAYHIQEFTVLRACVSSLRQKYGIPAEYFTARSLRVHGYLPPVSEFCKDDYVQKCIDQKLKGSPLSGIANDYNVIFSRKGRGCSVEAYRACLQKLKEVRIGGNAKLVTVRSTGFGKRGQGRKYINLVLSRPSDGRSFGVVSMSTDPGRKIPLLLVYNGAGDDIVGGPLIMRSKSPVDLSRVRELHVRLMAGVQLRDLFSSGHAYSKESWGLFVR